MSSIKSKPVPRKIKLVDECGIWFESTAKIGYDIEKQADNLFKKITKKYPDVSLLDICYIIRQTIDYSRVVKDTTEKMKIYKKGNKK